MSFAQKLKEELKAVALTTLYFAVWLGVLVVLKSLILAEYDIKFRGLSFALIGALVMAKVVLVMEHVPLGSWIHRRPLALDVIVRTALYGLGVLVVLLIEKSFEARHEFGGFFPALIRIFQHRDMPHVWADTICVAGGLLWFNVFSVVRRQWGEQELIRLFLAPQEAGDKAGLKEL